MRAFCEAKWEGLSGLLIGGKGAAANGKLVECHRTHSLARYVATHFVKHISLL